ncbi:MAG: hypothetical protein SFZ23_00990 [Planctomycetota bacterium]|nr:hypothetical protein [Planctomycetota bacterium]
MDVVLSPYHLVTREPVAMVSLLLAGRVVTLMPRPAEANSAGSFARAARELPTYLRFLEASAWCKPLWDARVLENGTGGATAEADMREARWSLDHHPKLGALRAFTRGGRDYDEPAFVEWFAADLLKGGPDPSISLPVAAGLDRFASRHGMFSARSEPSSLAQQAEASMAHPVWVVALPVLVQGSARSLMGFRQMLEAPLNDLREALVNAARSGTRMIEATAGASSTRRGSGSVGRASPSRARTKVHSAQSLDLGVEDAARAYAEAFQACAADDRPPADEERPVIGMATVSCVRLPVEAVLISSLAAIGAATSRSERFDADAAARAVNASHADAHRAGGSSVGGAHAGSHGIGAGALSETGPLLGLVVKPLGIRSKSSRLDRSRSRS